MRSHQPAAKAALVALLKDAYAAIPKPVPVSYGHPGGGLQDEHVYVWDTDDESDQEWASVGARARNETFTFKLEVLSKVPGRTQQKATERVFDLLSVVETVLVENVSLGILGVQVAELKSPRLTEGYLPDNEGFAALIESAVRIRARIERAS